MKIDKLGSSHYQKMKLFAHQAKVIGDELGPEVVIGYDPTGVRLDVSAAIVQLIHRINELENEKYQ